MNKNGQTLEAVVLLVIFVAAFLCMRSYLKRSLQANWRSNADSFSDEQFDPDLSQEAVSSLVFAGTTITSDLTGNTNLLGRDGDIKEIPGWGTYHAEEED